MFNRMENVNSTKFEKNVFKRYIESPRVRTIACSCHRARPKIALTTARQKASIKKAKYFIFEMVRLEIDRKKCMKTNLAPWWTSYGTNIGNSLRFSTYRNFDWVFCFCIWPHLKQVV